MSKIIRNRPFLCKWLGVICFLLTGASTAATDDISYLEMLADDESVHQLIECISPDIKCETVAEDIIRAMVAEELREHKQVLIERIGHSETIYGAALQNLLHDLPDHFSSDAVVDSLTQFYSGSALWGGVNFLLNEQLQWHERIDSNPLVGDIMVYLADGGVPEINTMLPMGQQLRQAVNYYLTNQMLLSSINAYDLPLGYIRHHLYRDLASLNIVGWGDKQAQVALSAYNQYRGAFNLGYSRLDDEAHNARSLLNLSWSRQFGSGITAFINANRELSGDEGRGISLALKMPLGGSDSARQLARHDMRADWSRSMQLANQGSIYAQQRVHESFAIMQAEADSRLMNAQHLVANTSPMGKLLVAGLHTYLQTRTDVDPLNPLPADLFFADMGINSCFAGLDSGLHGINQAPARHCRFPASTRVDGPT